MMLFDSSAWIEMLARRPGAQALRDRMEEDQIVVPTIVLYEVYKWMQREVSVAAARETAMELKQHVVVDLDADTALSAATTSLEHGLAMADAVVYVTALLHDATLVTGDADFADLPGVECIPVEGP